MVCLKIGRLTARVAQAGMGRYLILYDYITGDGLLIILGGISIWFLLVSY
jgi:hypothetical protein